MKKKVFKAMVIVITSLALAGCTVIFQRGRRSDVRKIEELSSQLDELNRTRGLLEERLSQEIKDKQVKLEMLEKGLVITVVGDLLFDSGKAKVRPQAYPLLDKVARVLKEEASDFNIGIEGHTDNQPIKVSGWKSNWELSAHRALSVLDYLANQKGIAPERLSAIGYGEYQPVSSNDIKDGRQLNRRVEIIILPQLKKIKEGSDTRKTQENLK